MRRFELAAQADAAALAAQVKAAHRALRDALHQYGVADRAVGREICIIASNDRAAIIAFQDAP